MSVQGLSASLPRKHHYMTMTFVNKQALGFDPKVDKYVPQAVGIFGGFYLLYFTEKILKIILKVEHEVGFKHI